MKLGHVGIYVNDFEKMQDFYENTIGFVVTDRHRDEKRGICFFTGNPQSHHEFVIAYGRKPEEMNVQMVNQVSFIVDDLKTLKEIDQRLRDYGVEEYDPCTHGIAWSIYFKDPEGNRTEFYVDTPWYITQPHKTPVDFTKPADQIYQETEALCRAAPGFQSMESWEAETRKKIAAKLLKA
ncbi:VOC family protein [Sinorhizobium meliloti]|uniref:VOC family protein n=1 Tax=Rhizobium meliloti TaxID=382 RepID=UPI003F1895AF